MASPPRQAASRFAGSATSSRTASTGGNPIPRLTVAAFGALAAFAVLLSITLRLLGEPALWWFTGALTALLAVVNALGAIVWRHTLAIQRSEVRLRRFLTPPRRLRLTREGKWFCGITLLLGFGAVNTGNNLLYLLLGMMLSLILASGILSEISLRGLVATRQPPSRIEATRPVLMGLALKNGKRRFPSFSIEVEDLLDGKPLDKKCYFLKVPSGREQSTSYRHQFSRRGRYRFTGMQLSTRFPFGLFAKSRRIELPVELIVLPRLHPVLGQHANANAILGDETRGRRSRQGDFAGLRDLRDGDDPRDIHWRTSARRGRPVVREHEDESARRMTIVVDNSLPGGARCGEPGLLEDLERAVSHAASLAVHYLERGYVVRVVARGEGVSWGTGASHRDRILRALALLATVDEQVPWASSVTDTANPGSAGESIHVDARNAPRRAARDGA